MTSLMILLSNSFNLTMRGKNQPTKKIKVNKTLSNKKKLIGTFLIVTPVVGLIMLMIIYQVVIVFSDVLELGVVADVLNILTGLLAIIMVIGILIGLPMGVIMLAKSKSTKNKFSASQAIKFGWQKFKENWLYLMVVLLIVLILENLPEVYYLFQSEIFFVQYKLLVGVVDIIFSVIALGFSLGLMIIALKLVDGLKPDYRDLFAGFNKLGQYIIGSMFYGLIVITGLILFVVPGVILAVKYQFFPYYIVEGATPFEALKKSGQATSGVKMDLVLFLLLVGLMNLAGLFAFVVGIFVTIPTTMIAIAYVYRKMLSKT